MTDAQTPPFDRQCPCMQSPPAKRPRSDFLIIFAHGLRHLAYAVFVLSVVWLVFGVIGAVKRWPTASGQPGRIELVAHIIDKQDADPEAARCWVPYHEPTLVNVIPLQVDRVLAGEFPHQQLWCRDHLYQLHWDTMCNMYGLRLELEWNFEHGLYIVRDHRAATLPRTFLAFILPASIAFLLALAARRFVHWAHGDCS